MSRPVFLPQAAGPDFVPVQNSNGIVSFLEMQPFERAQGPTQPSIQQLPDALSTAVNQPECEADYPHAYSAEIKNGGAKPPLPQMYSYSIAQLLQSREIFIPWQAF